MRSKLPKPWLVLQQEQPGRYLGSEQINKPSLGRRGEIARVYIYQLIYSLHSVPPVHQDSISARPFTFYRQTSIFPLPSGQTLLEDPQRSQASQCPGRIYLVHDRGRWRLDAWLLVREGQLFQEVHVGQGIFQGHVGGHGCSFCILLCGKGREGQ